MAKTLKAHQGSARWVCAITFWRDILRESSNLSTPVPSYLDFIGFVLLVPLFVKLLPRSGLGGLAHQSKE